MSIIKKIFITDAEKTEKNIKNNADAIYAECFNYFDKYVSLNGADARRDYFLTSEYRYLYEVKGKLNMSDAKNPKAVMNGTNKNIAEKMRKIAQLKDEFYTWVNNGEQTDVTSLAGIYNAIKPKPVKTETTDETTDETSETTETQEKQKRTKEEFVEWVFNQAFKEFGMTPENFLEFLSSDEGAKGFDKALDKIAS